MVKIEEIRKCICDDGANGGTYLDINLEGEISQISCVYCDRVWSINNVSTEEELIESWNSGSV